MTSDGVTPPVDILRPPGPGGPKIMAKEILWLTLTGAGLLIVYFSPLRDHLTHIQRINEDLQRLGHLSSIAFVALTAVLIAMGFPRMLISPIAGMAFGLWEGLFLSLLGSLIGSYGTFVYARWAGRDLLLRKWPALGRISGFVDDRRPVIKVALLRQLPNPGILTNLFLGISPVRHHAFLAGTAIGYLPSALPATLIGSSALAETTGERTLIMTAAAAMIVLIWAGFTLYIRRMRKAGRKPDAGTQDRQPSGIAP